MSFFSCAWLCVPVADLVWEPPGEGIMAANNNRTKIPAIDLVWFLMADPPARYSARLF
jgi:hypothetical protein